MQLPIGYDNFRDLIENRLDFVDKTLFIQEVLDDKTTQVAVITRPRRFGKTLNLSMLHHFLAAETYGQSTQGLFNHLKIMQADERYIHLERKLHGLMEQTVSSHDTSRDPEAFYHGLMIGLTASLYHSSNYEIQSNRESGYGRYDYLIFSRDKNKPTLLLEFKKVTASKNNKHAEQLEVQLEPAAREAVQQIAQQNYLAEAQKRGATQILKIGLSFCGKRFKIYSE